MVSCGQGANVAAALEPGVVASEVGRKLGYTRASCSGGGNSSASGRAPVAFNPVAVAPVQAAPALALPTPSPEQAGTVEIEFATGGRMRISGSF
jgi:hypothetical protein